MTLSVSTTPGGYVFTVTQFGQNLLDTVGVFRLSIGALYLKNANSTGSADIAFSLGMGEDYPIASNWNGLPWQRVKWHE